MPQQKTPPPTPFGRPMIPGTPQVGDMSQVPGPNHIFAEHGWRPGYAFPGLHPFLDAAAEQAGWTDHGLRSRLKSDWFYVQAGSALGNAANHREPKVITDSLTRARVIRDALQLAIHAIDDAIDTIESKLDLNGK